jgi:1,4-alpha-glucan branching enzyme
MFTRPLALAAVCLAAAPVFAAQDDNVQWDLVSHLAADRAPRVPLAGETFHLSFQTARFDLTDAAVLVDHDADGIDVQVIPATFDANRGPYDRWTAQVPATTANTIAYAIRLTDGSDTDYLTANGVSDELPSGGWWTIDFTTFDHAPMGATPTAHGTVFKVWAPNASTASVRGDFNAWSTVDTLTKQGDLFVGLVEEAEPGDRYKFFFDSFLWKPDPYARYLLGNQNYNSVIVDPDAYEWQNPNFSPAPREEWVVYQLHVGTFAGLNDPVGPTPSVSGYADVTARVDHLVELGVNAVMLNPINEFPGEISGGYNSISMHAFESTYGTPDELKEMIDTLHGAGIAVFLDVVWNHFPSNDNYLWNFDGSQVYFDSPAVGTPWGPQADIDRPEVYDYFFDSIETVMGEYRMDGYRQDAVYELVSATQFASGQSLIRAFTDRVRNRFADGHLVAEIYNNSEWNTGPQGMNFHGQYHEAYKNAIYQAVEDAAFGDPDMGRLVNAIDGTSGAFQTSAFNYYELHDEAWGLSGEGRTRAVRRIDVTWPHDDRYALGRTKLANGLTILSQGMPAILQGTEWAEDNGWEEEKIDWSHKDTYRGVFDFYRDLIGLRTSTPALFADSGISISHVNEGANAFAFERFGDDGRSYLVVANFSNTDFNEYIVGVPRDGQWGVIINSEDADYQGTGFGTPAGPVDVEPVAYDGWNQRVRLSLPAHGFLLLQHDPEYIDDPDIDNACIADLNNDGQVDGADFGAFGDAFGSDAGQDRFNPAADFNADGVIDGADFGAFGVEFGRTDCLD